MTKVRQLKEIINAIVEGLIVFMVFGGLTALYFVVER